MKLNINSKEFLKALKVVGACVKQKNTMPILDNILLQLSNNRMIIIADNLEIRSQIEVKVNFQGKINTCINYNLVTGILNNLPNVGIDLIFTSKTLTLEYHSGEYNIPLVDAKAFPSVTELKNPQDIKINALDFSEALGKAILFTETDNLSNLHNILIKINENSVKVVSVFGIAIIYEYSIKASGNPSEILISRDVAKYLIQTITNDEEITLNYTDTHLLINLEGRLIKTIQSQGKFPKYARVLDSFKSDKVLNIQKDVIYPSIKRLNALTDQNSNLLSLNLKENKLEMKFNNSLSNYNAEEVVDCEYEGEGLEISFNASYVVNMVSALDDNIQMKLSASNRPCMFYSENSRALIGPVSV